MRDIIRLPAAGLACIALAGCVEQAAPVTAAPASAAPAATGSAGTRFDGTFTGPLGAPAAADNRTTCFQSGTPMTLRVVNGQLRGAIFFRSFNGPVGADGSFNLTGPDTRQNSTPGTIEGRVTATGIEGSFSYRPGNRGGCSYSLNGMRRA